LRYSIFFLAVLLSLTGCSSLDSILYSPTQTPDTWLLIQPFAEFKLGSQTILIIQPTTTAIVYLLGLVTLGAGLAFWYGRNQNRSHFWWGIALFCWGVGALFAGTSYEAFSYQIKCVGREFCIWTSAWEIFYLFLSAASVDAMLIAQAYACFTGKWQKVLVYTALTKLALYGLALLVGSLVPIKFLISFELLILAAAPNIVLFFILNGWRYRKFKQRMDLVLLGAWVWLGITIAAYFLYMLSGFTQHLWEQGVWLSENDVLHIGLIIWMFYLARVAAPQVKDAPAQFVSSE